MSGWQRIDSSRDEMSEDEGGTTTRSIWSTRPQEKRLNARFSGIVLFSDKISVEGCVIGVGDTDGGHLYEFEAHANRGEDAVASGAVNFLVYGSKASTANYAKIERVSR